MKFGVDRDALLLYTSCGTQNFVLVYRLSDFRAVPCGGKCREYQGLLTCCENSEALFGLE